MRVLACDFKQIIAIGFCNVHKSLMNLTWTLHSNRTSICNMYRLTFCRKPKLSLLIKTLRNILLLWYYSQAVRHIGSNKFDRIKI